jgi:segregation and condensation protein B
MTANELLQEQLPGQLPGQLPLKQIIEAALMAADFPLSVEQLQSLFDEYERPDTKVIRAALNELIADCAERGVELREVATGFRYQSKQDYARWLQKLWEERAPRYSRAFIETLVLIAYRQPITRAEIEEIRGVAVNTQIIKTLIEREWIKVVGHREVPGKPELLGTTRAFLDYFSLKSLSELPTLQEIQDLEQQGNALEKQLQLEGLAAATAMISEATLPLETIPSTISVIEIKAEVDDIEAIVEEIDGAAEELLEEGELLEEELEFETEEGKS